MIKKIFVFLCCLCVVFAVWAEDERPEFSVQAEISTFKEADECYVLLLLDGTGETMVAAKAAADKKYKAFSEIVKKQFPQAKETIIAVNFGTRDFCSFQLTENPFTPNVTKVLLYTLPSDEDKALELLDCGIQAGLTPFCGASRDGEFGAVFFGLKDPESVIDGLYPACNQKLIQEVQKLSRGQELFQIKSAARDFPLERFHEVYYKDIKIVLPSEFCSTEKSRIKVTLILRATLQANK